MSWHPQIMFQLLAKYQHRECDGQHIPLVPEAEDPIVWTKVARLAKNDDVEIYNRDDIQQLDHYGDKVQFCPSCRVSAPLKCAFHQLLT